MGALLSVAADAAGDELTGHVLFPAGYDLLFGHPSAYSPAGCVRVADFCPPSEGFAVGVVLCACLAGCRRETIVWWQCFCGIDCGRHR